MARTVIEFSGVLANTQILYTCPVGKIAKVMFRTLVNAAESTPLDFGEYSEHLNHIKESGTGESVFYVGKSVPMKVVSGQLSHGAIVMPSGGKLAFVAASSTKLNENDSIFYLDKDSLIIVENETIRFEEGGVGTCAYSFLLFEDDM